MEQWSNHKIIFLFLFKKVNNVPSKSSDSKFSRNNYLQKIIKTHLENHIKNKAWNQLILFVYIFNRMLDFIMFYFQTR